MSQTRLADTQASLRFDLPEERELADKQAQLEKSVSRVRETNSDQAQRTDKTIAELQAQIAALDKRDADLQKTPRGDMTILRGILKKERDRLEGELATIQHGRRAD